MSEIDRLVDRFIVPPLSSVYHNLLHTTVFTVSAGGIAYALTRYAKHQMVAIDPKIAMTFTAVTTLFYLTVRPTLIYLDDKHKNWSGRTIASLALSMLTKKHLNLDNSTFIKTVVLAGLLIGGFEYLELFNDPITRSSAENSSDLYTSGNYGFDSHYSLRDGPSHPTLRSYGDPTGNSRIVRSPRNPGGHEGGAPRPPFSLSLPTSMPPNTSFNNSSSSNTEDL